MSYKTTSSFSPDGHSGHKVIETGQFNLQLPDNSLKFLFLVVVAHPAHDLKCVCSEMPFYSSCLLQEVI